MKIIKWMMMVKCKQDYKKDDDDNAVDGDYEVDDDNS